MNDLMWFGYLHENGSVHVKRWFGDRKDYEDDMDGNDFIARVVPPFKADSREKATEIITRRLSE